MSDTTVSAKEREVEQQREQLADTVDALQAKLDVKSHAKERIREVQDKVTTDEGKPRPEVVAGAAAVLVGLVALVWWRRG